MDFNAKAQLTDDEFRQALKKQQEAYTASASSSNSTGAVESNISPAEHARPKSSKYTVKRSGGGKTWSDSSLLEWDPTHFRLFVGNLSGEVTDEMITQAFAAYPSVSKVRTVIDAKSQKCKGFGFVAFKSPDDYFKAYKEMNGKYIGNHPCQLKRAQTDVKPLKKSASSSRRHNHNQKPYNRK